MNKHASLHASLSCSAATSGASLSLRLTDPISKPPTTNEPRVVGGPLLRQIPYPRAALSSCAFNLAAVLMCLPPATRRPRGGAASLLILRGLLHAMGLFSFANWTTRREWARLADISCMLVSGRRVEREICHRSAEQQLSRRSRQSRFNPGLQPRR